MSLLFYQNLIKNLTFFHFWGFGLFDLFYFLGPGIPALKKKRIYLTFSLSPFHRGNLWYFVSLLLHVWPFSLGFVHKWCHGFRGRGKGFCDDNYKALAIKSMKKWGQKLSKICVTAVVDDPIFEWYLLIKKCV